MRQKYFIKATLKNGVAGYDKKTEYHIGLNKHPNPDSESVKPCGIGIHLARNITRAMAYAHDAEEFYLATAGRILGKDESKVRTDECQILCLIPQRIIDEHKGRQRLTDDEYETKLKLIEDEYKADNQVL